MVLRAEGQKEIADILKTCVTSPSPKLSNEQALAIFVDAKLSKRSYNIVREPAKNIYPSYDSISAAKKKCYPSDQYFDISEDHCKIDLQELLNHTVSRIIHLIEFKFTDFSHKNFRLILKWGMDGTTLNEYNQKFKNADCSDAHIFLTSFVPLKLLQGEIVIWENNYPSSTRYCRPVFIQLAKETADTTCQENDRMNTEILKLRPCILKVNGTQFIITFELIMSMVDGKTVNAVTHTKSAQRCYLCKATSAQFNNVDKMLKIPVNTKFLDFGLSGLHCWIRCFECLLHIAYRLGFCKWVKTAHIEQFNSTKQRIQNDFFRRLGLHIDKPRSGFGTSNNGNTARRFFANAEVSSEITGVDLGLIIRFRTLLAAISSGERIDPSKFKRYATETAFYYIKLYDWYCMPTTVHKLLIHGYEIIDKTSIPIGKLSEEAQESMNKEMRRMRENHAWKGSRESTMGDMFRGLLLASDPVVSSFRHNQQKSRTRFPPEVQNLLIMDDDNDDNNDDDVEK